MKWARLRFWGVRGSFPASRAGCRQLGGNTSCVQLEWQEQQLILDAGTGIRKLGESLVSSLPLHPLHLLISHPHWDHIQGFPFFAPAYSERCRLVVHSLRRPLSLQRLLADQQRASFFSTPLERLESQLEFREWDEGESVQLGPFRVETWRLNHPGICSGFRVEMGASSLAYLSDVAPSELLLAQDYASGLSSREALVRLHENQLRLAHRADAVIYDTFFTPEQYALRGHWGHSTLEHALEICRQSLAASLFLFHHNSEIPDPLQRLRIPADSPLPVHLAQEGASFEFHPTGIRPCE